MSEHDQDLPEDDQPAPPFQWRWVVISLGLYAVLYFLPLMLIPGGLLSDEPASGVTVIVIGIWGTAGIFLISAGAAYYSPGVTVWEPVASALGLVLLLAAASSVRYNELIVASTPRALEFGIMLFAAFALSYFGAWWGERNQMLRRLIEEEGDVVEEAAPDDAAGSSPGSGAG